MRVVIENLDTAPTPTQMHANKTKFTHTSVVKELDDTRPLACQPHMHIPTRTLKRISTHAYAQVCTKAKAGRRD